MDTAANRAAPGPTVRQSGSRRIALRRNLEGWLFASPWVIGFLLWTLGPMLASFVLAFSETFFTTFLTPLLTTFLTPL